MVRSYPDLQGTAIKFVQKYLEYGEPDGRRAAKEASGLAGRAIVYLTNPNILAAIREAGGVEPQLRSLAITPEEHRFIDVYLETLSREKTAEKLNMTNQAVDAVLQRAGVRNEIEIRLQELRTQSIVRAEEILEELAIIGFSNITDYCSFDHDTVVIKNSDKMINTQAIAEVTNTREGVKLKLHNKLQALDSLAKYMGMYRDKLEITGKDGGPIQVESPMDSINKKLDTMFDNKKSLDDIKSEEKKEESVEEDDDGNR